MKSKDCDMRVNRVEDKFMGLPPLAVLEVTQRSGNGNSTICYQVMEHEGSDDDCCMALLEALCRGENCTRGKLLQVERFDAIGLKRPGSLQELAIQLAVV